MCLNTRNIFVNNARQKRYQTLPRFHRYITSTYLEKRFCSQRRPLNGLLKYPSTSCGKIIYSSFSSISHLRHNEHVRSIRYIQIQTLMIINLKMTEKYVIYRFVGQYSSEFRWLSRLSDDFSLIFARVGLAYEVRALKFRTARQPIRMLHFIRFRTGGQ